MFIKPRSVLDSLRRKSSKKRDVEPVGRLWPSGGFGFAMVEHGRRERRSDADEYREFLHERCSIEARVRKAEKYFPATIGLASASNSHTRPCRGLKGLTAYGANMVRSGATLLQDSYGKGRLAFLTVTPPSLDDDDWEAWAGEWESAIRVFLQAVKRMLRRRGLPSLIVAVTELQQRRSEALGGVPAWHLHLLFVGSKRPYAPEISPRIFRLAWRRAWLSRLKGDYDWSRVENVRFVKKSAAGYLSKYMTKGSDCIESVAQQGYHIPASWYSLSAELRAEIKKTTLTGGVAMGLVEWLCWNKRQGRAWASDYVDSVSPVRIEVDGSAEGIVVGYYGYLTKRGRDWIYREVTGGRPTIDRTVYGR